ncbi:MAG: lipopolysaccharide assembly protein LapA domain-containing protein [Burkholderiaceae bacterium]|nr:lipopolysaccharide assembly protein LapA domain-containing protein [Burkholderiaceae bacterium]
MKAIAWLVRLVFFAVVLWFAVKNTTPVPVKLTETLHWDDVPLIVVMLACVLIGVAAGTIALAPRLFSLRRQVAALRRQAQRATPADAAAERLADQVASAARNVGAVGELGADTRYPR